MKKFLKYIICLTMMLALVGCQKTKDESDKVKILCPVGAPSLAFVGEYENIIDDGEIDFVDGSDQLIAELSKADSEYDIIVAPINVGAKLIAANQTDYKLKAILTWGNLYLVGTSQDALKEEGEIALFGEGAVPQKIYETVNVDTTLEGKYYQSATLVQQQLLSGKVHVGLLAEPAATATVAKSNNQLSIIANLQELYGGNGYPQAAVFVKDGKNFDQLFDSIDHFTNNGYDGLQEGLETIGVENLSLPSVKITIKSIDRQNVHYKEASECQNDIKDFLKLFNIEYTDDMLAS